MDVISFAKVREHLAETMEKVCDEHEPVVISRENARPVVLLSLADYESIVETAYLLRSPANAARLRASVEELRVGGGTERELID